MFLMVCFNMCFMWFFILCVVLLVNVIVRILFGWVCFVFSKCIICVVKVLVFLVFVFVSIKIGLFNVFMVLCCVGLSLFRYGIGCVVIVWVDRDVFLKVLNLLKLFMGEFYWFCDVLKRYVCLMFVGWYGMNKRNLIKFDKLNLMLLMDFLEFVC